MAARKQGGERKPRKRRGPSSQDATILRMLRGSRGLDQGELNARAQLGTGKVGKYERDTSKLTTEDQRKILEALDYPDRAWTETAAHLRRLNVLRSRYAARGGARDQVADRANDAGLAGFVREPEARLDPSAARQELSRIAETAGRNLEELLQDTLTLLTECLRRDPGSGH